MAEVWGDIVGWEGYYQVSNLGRVKSLPRKYKLFGVRDHTSKERILKPSLNPDGYRIVSFNLDDRSEYYSVSRLVAKAFIPNPDNLPCVNHKNRIRHDNRVENLEWCTHKYNTDYAVEHGGFLTMPRGTDHYANRRTKLNDEKVRDIRENKENLTCKELGMKFGISSVNAWRIKNNTYWKHVV